MSDPQRVSSASNTPMELRVTDDGDGIRRTFTRPRIVTLCGSKQFAEAYFAANEMLTMAGYIVLTVGCLGVAGCTGHSSDVKAMLDSLHLRKIEMSDEVFVLNVDGYIGESTAREIAYATVLGKQIEWWHPDKAAVVRVEGGNIIIAAAPTARGAGMYLTRTGDGVPSHGGVPFDVDGPYSTWPQR